MSEHFNSEAIDRYLAGEHSPAAESHLSECAECREAVSQLETAVERFRASARFWSESQPHSHPPAEWARSAERSAARRRWIAPARWAAVATAVLALAALPLYTKYSERQAAAQAQADAQLLEEVSTDISRPAPEPLEPLIELVSQSTTGDNQ